MLPSNEGSPINIGIYGGSFNPPHWAHIIAAQAFKREAALSLLYIVPVAPYKAGGRDVSVTDSLIMCHEAFSGIRGAVVWEKERRSEKFSYTVDVLREISECNKNAHLMYLVGTDVLLYMPRWYAIEEILALADVYYLRRGDSMDAHLKQSVLQLEKLGGRLYPMKTQVPSISSTKVRQNLRHGKAISSLVPWPVANYIKEHGLYV